MKIMIIGGGGREHVLCWAIKKSPDCEKVYCAPGNAGIAQIAECLPINVEDNAGILAACQELGIDLAIIGPEVPLVNGIVDILSAAGIRCFGPHQEAAMIEGSKIFMKEVLVRSSVPTAEYRKFTDIEKAKTYVLEKGAPIVIKADGLAAGKGVTVANTIEEALVALDNAMTKRVFGDAGRSVIIEECLYGEEVGFSTLCNGTVSIPFAAAQGHKAVFDNDKGPNTGGMGAYSPVPVIDIKMENHIMQTIIQPVLNTMNEMGKPFNGVLYAGLMMTKDGPKVLEFNARFGDPEIQAILPRLKTDFLHVLWAASEGRLSDINLTWHNLAGVCVVMAAEGYPGEPRKGTVIENLPAAANVPNAFVFHSGTKKDSEGRILASGGRVLGITATGSNVKAAQELAYQALDQIVWPEGFCRRDIGWRAIEKGA